MGKVLDRDYLHAGRMRFVTGRCAFGGQITEIGAHRAEPRARSAPQRFASDTPATAKRRLAPPTLERAMIMDGLQPIRDQVMACGMTWPNAGGRVKVNVQVAPDGRVVHTAVTQAPHLRRQAMRRPCFARDGALDAGVRPGRSSPKLTAEEQTQLDATT